jgi:hypothetical protein
VCKIGSRLRAQYFLSRRSCFFAEEDPGLTSSNFLQINTKSLIQRQSTGRASAPTPSVKRTERPKYPPPRGARAQGSRRFVRVTQGERGHPTSSLGNIMMMASRERGGLCHSNEGRAESSVNRPWRPCGVIRRLAMKARAGSCLVECSNRDF